MSGSENNRTDSSSTHEDTSSTNGGPSADLTANVEAKLINPYAVLNISPNASTDEIQKSYKSLSRSFHPDKQPPGENRDIAQKYFIQFKSSYDILMDPILRLGYDTYGMRGVLFLLKSIKTYKAMEEVMTLLDPQDTERRRYVILRRAKDILSEGLQYHEFLIHNHYQQPSLSGDITVKCNSTHSAFLGEGIEPAGVEVEEMRMNVSIAKSPGSQTSLTFGGHSAIAQGQGSSGVQLSLNYEPVQQTSMNVDWSMGPNSEDTKVTIGTSHILSSQTYVAANLSAFVAKDVPWGVSFTSHRSMMENKITGTWVMGLALPTFQMQYGLLSFTSSFPDRPKYTAKFNIGMDYTPIKLLMEKTWDEEKQHVGKLSWGWGPRGIDVKASTTRSLTQYCKLTLGLHHVSARGLTWIFQLQRGTVRFTVPILITTVVSPAYAIKSMYMTLFLGTLDASLGDLVQNGIEGLSSKSSRNDALSKALRKEEALLDREKVKRDALNQLCLMEKPAEAKRIQEEERNGLVILKAVYSVVGGDSIDVTTALMFWVVKGRLQLPTTSKSSMLGFYDVRHETPIDVDVGYMDAWWRLWNKFWFGKPEQVIMSAAPTTPTLRVRYRHQGNLYEITILDEEELSLPSPKAMKLGDSNVS